MVDVAQEQTGLTSQQVAERVARGQVNTVALATSRSIGSIIRGNIFSLFNAILTVALVVVLILGHPQDALFIGVMIINALIGIISEYRSKQTLDALAIVDAPRVNVRRDDSVASVLVSDVVIDEIIELALGDQVVVDGPVLSSSGLEVDESMLTGESRPVRKEVGDQLLAGTSVVAGSGVMRAEKVGDDLYAQGIAKQARTFTLAVSEIQQGVNTVLKWISLSLVPLIGLTLWAQYRVADLGSNAWIPAVILAVAAIVGMIPQGLVLLTSMNFAIGSATLARRNVLMQELPAVEILARVDSLCLDKTGTLTTGKIALRDIEILDSTVEASLMGRILHIMNADATNPTAEAILTGLGEVEGSLVGVPAEVVPFSSARKWAGWSSAEYGTWLLGAPEILGCSAEVMAQVSAHAAQGLRVLALVRSTQPLVDDELPANRTSVALIILGEELRSDAEETLTWFAQQDVRVRVISGDNPETVVALARQLGLKAPDGTLARAIDARELPTDFTSEEFIDAINTYDVFGRVTPEQKRAMVRALQQRGHCVAMTGDGVNDALALKEADLGIAMGNAARATKAVAQVVLLDGRFSQLPEVVARGRRIIANMERVSSLFFSKTTYAALIVLVTSLLAWKFPFLPRHYTYIGSLTIGIPAFFVALGPNTRRYRPGFLRRALALAVPSGIILAVFALIVYGIIGVGTAEASTATALTMMIGAIWLLAITARPLVMWRLGLLVVVIVTAIGGAFLPFTRQFFALEIPATGSWGVILVASVISCGLIELNYRVQKRLVDLA